MASTSQAAASPHIARRKDLGHPSRDGATGMNLGTKRHLDDVKAKMAQYAWECEGYEYDHVHQHYPQNMWDGAHKAHHPSSSDRTHNHRQGSSSSSSSGRSHLKAVPLHGARQKSPNPVARDGVTGMTPLTKRHFAKVKAEIASYMDERHHHHHDRQQELKPSGAKHRGLLTRIFGDAKKKPQTPVSASNPVPIVANFTPMVVRKKPEHAPFATPQPVRRV